MSTDPEKADDLRKIFGLPPEPSKVVPPNAETTDDLRKVFGLSPGTSKNVASGVDSHRPTAPILPPVPAPILIPSIEKKTGSGTRSASDDVTMEMRVNRKVAFRVASLAVILFGVGLIAYQIYYYVPRLPWNGGGGGRETNPFYVWPSWILFYLGWNLWNWER